MTRSGGAGEGNYTAEKTKQSQNAKRLFALDVVQTLTFWAVILENQTTCVLDSHTLVISVDDVDVSCLGSETVAVSGNHTDKDKDRKGGLH